MKCRLYPNKEVAEKIDKAILGVKVFYNCTIWDIFNNFACTKEKVKKNKDTVIENETVHFLDLKELRSTERKKRLIAEHPIIGEAPDSAISSSVYGITVDIAKSIGKNPIEFQKPKFYNAKHPRRSYTYRDTFSKLSMEENNNVLYMNLQKIGLVKIRGWNKSIRFDKEGKIDFTEYVQQNKQERAGFTISKDNCGDYWMSIKLKNVFKPISLKEGNSTGIDVGIKDVMILSDGTKFENMKFKKNEKKHIRALNRRLSRRDGWANIKFRTKYKENKQDKSIVPSKRYERTKIKLSKLHRRIEWKRRTYNNIITAKIISDYDFIGVETLNIKGMFRNKHLSNALSDAAMGEILSMLKYKAEWNGRTIQPIEMFTPSSKRCNNCGYILPKLTLSTRSWTCPQCGKHHDRDVNAANNILYYAEDIRLKSNS